MLNLIRKWSRPRSLGRQFLLALLEDAMARICRCEHGEEAHTHNRAGTDCSLCECARFGSAD